MNRDTAIRSIQDYVQGWVQQDLDLALGVLSPQIVIVENDGSVYQGHAEVRAWFADWHAAPKSGRVLRWQLDAILFDDTTGRAAVEWEFECAFQGQVYSFPGASLFHFDAVGISCIHEFRMEKDQRRPYQSQP